MKRTHQGITAAFRHYPAALSVHYYHYAYSAFTIQLLVFGFPHSASRFQLPTFNFQLSAILLRLFSFRLHHEASNCLKPSPTQSTVLTRYSLDRHRRGLEKFSSRWVYHGFASSLAFSITICLPFDNNAAEPPTIQQLKPALAAVNYLSALSALVLPCLPSSNHLSPVQRYNERRWIWVDEEVPGHSRRMGKRWITRLMDWRCITCSTAGHCLFSRVADCSDKA